MWSVKCRSTDSLLQAAHGPPARQPVGRRPGHRRGRKRCPSGGGWRSTRRNSRTIGSSTIVSRLLGTAPPFGTIPFRGRLRPAPAITTTYSPLGFGRLDRSQQLRNRPAVHRLVDLGQLMRQRGRPVAVDAERILQEGLDPVRALVEDQRVWRVRIDLEESPAAGRPCGARSRDR